MNEKGAYIMKVKNVIFDFYHYESVDEWMAIKFATCILLKQMQFSPCTAEGDMIEGEKLI